MHLVRRWAAAWCALACLLGAPSAFAAASPAVGVVLMHAKDSSGAWLMGVLSLRLREAGYRVITPEMPWSESRKFDRSFDEAMTEIDKAVETLRAQGARQIVVGGQDIGANAALAYGARRAGLMAVLAIGAGHMPELPGEDRAHNSADVARARALVAAGKGDQAEHFVDWADGDELSLSVTPRIYLSYFDPDGPAVMPVNAAKLTAPLLWAVGLEDHVLYALGRAYVFDRAPPDPRNRYLPVYSGHLDTPTAAAEDITAWLNDLRDGR